MTPAQQNFREAVGALQASFEQVKVISTTENLKLRGTIDTTISTLKDRDLTPYDKELLNKATEQIGSISIPKPTVVPVYDSETKKVEKFKAPNLMGSEGLQNLSQQIQAVFNFLKIETQ